VNAQDASAILWDAEWARAWKAHPENVWFTYEAEVYLDQLGPLDPAARALKTDAFDEACGRGQLSAGLGDDVVLVDVAPKILAHATRTRAEAVPCVADVRCLPFRTGSFDLILSTSTLDHFEAGGEIDAALAELRRILGDRGRLLLTLDNPRNPILRVRHLVHAVTGKVAGLIPFRMGQTLSRRALVDALERAGFAVSESGYLVHAPRLFALWAGEWAARRHDATNARRLDWLFRAVERHARHVPTRRWTGHFVFADCRPAPPSRSGPPRGAHARWLVRFKVAEHRLRCAYLRHTPAAVLGRIDPPLRRLAAGGRRVAAVPVYLRNALTTVTGVCDGGPARVAHWAARGDRGVLLDALLDERTSIAGGDVHGVTAIASNATALARDADVLVAATTPALAPRLRRAGFHIVPGMVRFGGEPVALLEHIARRPRMLQADLQRLRHTAYRAEVWKYSLARSRLFYHRYLAPHVAARFGTHAELGSFAFIDRLFAAGAAVAVIRPGAREPDAIGLVVARAATLWCVVLGTRDADRAILRAGGLAAVYRAQIELAHERGARLVDFGRCLPWAADGVVQYKMKWGIQPIPDGTQTLEYAVKVLRPESAVARRLVTRGVFVREGSTYRTFAPDDLNAR
jgi:SAM-dependent methyltransferase